MKCKIDWCNRDARARGFCYAHHKRFLKGTSLDRPIKGELKKCKVPGCNNAYLSMGFCNAHYIRYRKGKDLNTPIWVRKKICIDCGSKTGNGGQGRCRQHYKQFLKKARSEMLIKALGGRCQKCQKIYPIGVYDFHHTNPKNKKFSISSQITNKSEDELLKEAKKCHLLCANCHRILHFGEFNE